MPYGMDTRTGVCFQNSFGTSLTSSMHWLQPVSNSVALKKAQLKQQGQNGNYDEGASYEGLNTVEGDIEIEAGPNDLGVLLCAAMNKVSTVTSSAVQTHIFRPRQADFDTLSAERPFTLMKNLGDTGSASLYGDLNGSNLELGMVNGELLTAKLGVVGGRFTQTASIAAVYSDHALLDWSVSSISLGGAARSNFRELTFGVENNIEAKATLSLVKTPQRCKRNGFRAITIAGTVTFDDQTDLQNFISQAEQRMVLNFRGPTAIQSGYFPELTIDMPAVRFTEFPTEIGGPGELEVSFSADCKYHAGSGNAVTLTLRNTRQYF